MKPPLNDQASSGDLPLFCWNKRRLCGAVSIPILLMAIPVQYVLRSDLLSFITGMTILVAIWIALKQFVRELNKKPGDCRYASKCDMALVFVISMLNVVLRVIDLGA